MKTTFDGNTVTVHSQQTGETIVVGMFPYSHDEHGRLESICPVDFSLDCPCPLPPTNGTPVWVVNASGHIVFGYTLGIAMGWVKKHVAARA